MHPFRGKKVLVVVINANKDGVNSEFFFFFFEKEDLKFY